MESSNISAESFNKLQLTFSEEPNDLNNRSIDFENSVLINYSQSKDYSMQNNFFNLEKDLKELSKEVKELRKKNLYLADSLTTVTNEKNEIVEKLKEELSQVLGKNKKLKEIIEKERKSSGKQIENLKSELSKSQKTVKKVAAAYEGKLKEIQKELNSKKEGFAYELQKKDNDVQDLLYRIKNIETSASHFKSSSSINQYHSAKLINKKSHSLLTSPKPAYSIDQLSEIIVGLEKNQAQLKERIHNEGHQSQINKELHVNEVKLGEVREMQKKILKSKQIV